MRLGQGESIERVGRQVCALNIGYQLCFHSPKQVVSNLDFGCIRYKGYSRVWTLLVIGFRVGSLFGRVWGRSSTVLKHGMKL